MKIADQADVCIARVVVISVTRGNHVYHVKVTIHRIAIGA